MELGSIYYKHTANLDDKTMFWAIEDDLLRDTPLGFYSYVNNKSDSFNLAEKTGNYFLDFTQGYGRFHSSVLPYKKRYEPIPYISMISAQSIVCDNTTWGSGVNIQSLGSYEHIYEVSGGGKNKQDFSGLLIAGLLDDINPGDELVTIPFNYKIDNEGNYKIVMTFVNHIFAWGLPSTQHAPLSIQIHSKSDEGTNYVDNKAVILEYDKIKNFINVEIPLQDINGDYITKFSLRSNGFPDNALGTIMLNSISIIDYDSTIQYDIFGIANKCYSHETGKYSVQARNSISNNDDQSKDPIFGYILVNGENSIFLGETGNTNFISSDLTGSFFSQLDDVVLRVNSRVGGEYYKTEYRDVVVSDESTISRETHSEETSFS